MAEVDLPILTNLSLDTNVFQDKVKNILTLSNALGEEIVTVLPAAATISADTGIHGEFTVPQNYASGPKAVIRGILDGDPSTLVIAFGIQMKPGADNEAYDLALNAQDIASASSVSHDDMDIYEEVIDPLTNAGTFVKGDDCPFFLYIDDDVHTYDGLFLLSGLFFRYTTT